MALFDYGNTRLRARLSNLLSFDRLVSFTDYTSIDSFLSSLIKTQYKESIETALTFAHGYACLSQAMRMELAQISEDLARFYQDEEARLVSLIFMRDDLLNLKTIVRGQIHEIPTDEIEDSFLALGSISLVYLKELAKAKNLNDMVNKMVVYQLPAAQMLLALRPSKKKLTSADVELALEKWFFQQVQDALKGNSESLALLREFYAIEADTINLNTALWAVRSPARFEDEPVEKYMFAEGNLPLRRMIKLAKADSVEDAVRSLFATKYGTYLKKGLACYADTHYLSEFENQMRMYLINWLSKLPKLFPLGIGVPLGYYARKRTEIYNLRWIGKGIESGFEPAYIRENLVRVQ
jgi:V/A-type H+-transporting ATPase subunit C